MTEEASVANQPKTGTVAWQDLTVPDAERLRDARGANAKLPPQWLNPRPGGGAHGPDRSQGLACSNGVGVDTEVLREG